MNVTFTITRHGDPEAHRTGCADLARGFQAGVRQRHYDAGSFDSRVDVAADYWSDMLDEQPETTPEQWASSIHFAPCLDALPMAKVAK